MKRLQDWDEAFLDQHFVKGKIQESNALDYKKFTVAQQVRY
jgi:hypothetical protein